MEVNFTPLGAVVFLVFCVIIIGGVMIAQVWWWNHRAKKNEKNRHGDE